MDIHKIFSLKNFWKVPLQGNLVVILEKSCLLLLSVSELQR
jgi:hypothetical protein